MNKSISYSFLLNIVILFVFVCGAIVSGIFSYYRAFKANTIIINEIEKFEGYNCLSKESIAERLSVIPYKVPFNVKCKGSYGSPCVTDDPDDGNYAIVAYNLEDNSSEGRYAFSSTTDNGFNSMNSKIYDDGSYTKEYQFGVYTYLYIDMPVISSFVRIPFFSKTQRLYEFRNIKQTPDKTKTYDLDFIPEDIVNNESEADYLNIYRDRLQEAYLEHNLMENESSYGVGISNYSYLNDASNRELFKYYSEKLSDSQNIKDYGRHECGFVIDWSAY